MKPTTVISVRGRKHAELVADPDFVYVGRAVKWTPWECSPWGNPYSVKAYGIGRAMELYEATLRALRVGDRQGLPPEWWELPWGIRERLIDGACRLRELQGKVLGCWCGDWKPSNPPLACHARVLAELADGLIGEGQA